MITLFINGENRQFTAPLTNLYEGNGGKILYNCTANELLTDENGAVVGVKGTMADGSTVTVPSLNNGGTATVVTFTARSTTTLRFSVTSVSAATGNVGPLTWAALLKK